MKDSDEDKAMSRFLRERGARKPAVADAPACGGSLHRAQGPEPDQDRLSSQGQELVEPLQEAGGGEGAMGS